MRISWLAETERHFPGARDGTLARVLKRFGGSMAWRRVSTAPFNCDVELHMSDDDGSHIIPFPCRQTDAGWINADLNVRLDIEPTAWRAWPAGKGPIRSDARINNRPGRSFRSAALKRPARVEMVPKG